MKNLLTFLLLSTCFYSKAQITFQKTFTGTANDAASHSVSQTTDGGYIMTGIIYDLNAGYGVCLIKTNSSGDTLWTNSFYGGAYELGFAVQQTLDGGYIISGTRDTPGTPNHYDVFLIKTDSIGNPLWIKTIGNTNTDNVEEGYSVQQTLDSGYIIAGYQVDNSVITANDDIYLIKTDATGNLLWTKTFGGLNNERAAAIQQTTDGGFIIAGWTNSFGSGSFDVYLIKTDSNGDSLWTKTYGGVNDDGANYIRQTQDGGYIITGHTGSYGAGDEDVYLLKTDSIGSILWSKTFGGTGYEQGYGVQPTTEGGYIITGCTTSFGSGDFDVYLIKTNSVGTSLWSKTFGGIGYDMGRSVRQTTDGGYIIGGWIDISGTGHSSVYLIKTDANGNTACNQLTPATIETTPPTQVSSTSTIAATSATIVTTQTTIVVSGSIDSTLCTLVGIKEILSNNSLVISPNPATDIFNISFERTITKGKIEISDILGKKVFEENIFYLSKMEISLKNISDGIYFVKVFDGEKMFTQKIIVQ